MAGKGGYWTFKARSRHHIVRTHIWLEAGLIGFYLLVMESVLACMSQHGLWCFDHFPSEGSVIRAFWVAFAGCAVRFFFARLMHDRPARRITVHGRGIKIEQVDGSQIEIPWNGVRWIAHNRPTGGIWIFRMPRGAVILTHECFSYVTWSAFCTHLYEYIPEAICLRNPWKDPVAISMRLSYGLTPSVWILLLGTTVLAYCNGLHFVSLFAFVLTVLYSVVAIGILIGRPGSPSGTTPDSKQGK